MRVSLENDLEHIGSQAWNGLVNQSPTQTVFQNYGWHLAWWKTFKKDHKLFIICINEAEQLIGLAPLYVLAKGRWRVIKFIGTGHSDYCDFLYPKGRPEVLEKMIHFLAEKKTEWDTAALDYIPQGSSTARFLASYCQKSRLYCVHYSSIPCPKVELEKNTVQDILKKKSLKRHEHYFQNRQGYEVLHLTDPQAIERFLEEFFDQHVKRRSTTKDKSLFLVPENRAFYRNLLNPLSSTGSLVFTVLKSEGRAIAFHFGFKSQGTFFWYKPSFDPALARHSPGGVLLKELLKYAADHHLSEFDFTVGQEPFKLRFANKEEKVLSFKIFQSKRILGLDLVRSSLKLLGKR